jgi:hypothetical protein
MNDKDFAKRMYIGTNDEQFVNIIIPITDIFRVLTILFHSKDRLLCMQRFVGVPQKHLGAGLPDGLFSNQKSQFVYILVGLGMENMVIFYDYLEYFKAIWYNFWPLGIV